MTRCNLHYIMLLPRGRAVFVVVGSVFLGGLLAIFSLSSTSILSSAERLSSSSAAQPPTPPRYYINPLYLRLGSTNSFRLDADKKSPLVSFKHPHFDTVVDVGAFDGTDYTLPSFRAGYDVYSF